MIVVLVLFILIACYKHFIGREDWTDSFLTATAISAVTGIILTIGVTLINGFTGHYDREVEFFDVKEVKHNCIVVINPEDSTSQDSIIIFRDVSVLNSGPSNQVKRVRVIPKDDWILPTFGGFFWKLTTDVEATLSEENMKKYNGDEPTN